MLQKIIFFTSIFTIWITNSYAQVDSTKKNSSFILEGDFENGGILGTTDLKQNTFDGAYYSGFNIRAGWRMSGSDDVYYRLYNNPTYGIGLYSSTFHTDVVGRPYA